jgi:hypothetical protein
MRLAAEISNALAGAWSLFRRRETALGHFDFSPAGFWHSLAALGLTVPLYVWAMAYERGRHLPEATLSDHLVALMSLDVIEAWVVLPVLAAGLASVLGLRDRLLPFLIALNWSGVLAVLLVLLPPLFWSLGWATEGVAAVYSLGFALLILQMRWFLSRLVLGVSGGVAALLVAADAGLELLLTGIFI